MDIDRGVQLPKLISLNDVSQMTSLKRSAIYLLISTGELPRIKIGRKVTFLQSDVVAFVQKKIEQSRQLEAA